MVRIFIILTVILGLFEVRAQEVQWASNVIDYSSELTSVQYAAIQILGEPNVLPQGGESPNAWTPSRPNKEEYVTVGFANPMQARQIVIGESYNPSAIKAVYAIDSRDTEHLIYEFTPRKVPKSGRVLNIIFDQTPYQVQAVKVVFDGSTDPDYYSVDAIGISNSYRPVEATVSVSDSLSADLSTERLSDNVNSQYKEYKPLLSPDGRTLYFSRKNHPENMGGINDPEDIWYSEKDEVGEWAPAKNAGPELNNPGPNFVSAITPDGNSVVILLGNQYLKNGKMGPGASIAYKEGDSWSKPQPVKIKNDYNYADKAHYFLTNNREVLLMSVERDDTQGGRDLYVSFYEEEGSWSEPQNLGSNVNTAGEESSPFLAADDRTLYFSSNGFSGFGGHDIYVSKRLDDTWLNWSMPTNMGPTINTNEEDMFFYVPVVGEYAYYSRGVTEDNTDIHRVKLPIFHMPDPVIAVQGQVFDNKTNEPLEARIVYERLSDGEELGMTKSHQNTGNYEIVLPRGELYGFRAEVEGYIPISENIDLRGEEEEYEVVRRDLRLVPIEKEAKIVINNVFFDFDNAKLKQESFSELNRITEFLKENENIRIELEGHTDNLGSAEYNMKLSKRRVSAVHKYFQDQGISKDRLEVKWYGESKPAASNETPEGREKNRRVEFTILSE